MILTPPLRVWTCDKCGIEERHATVGADQRWHRCRALGMDWPLFEAVTGARTVVVEREDYVGQETGLRFTGSRPVMAALTERPDGSNDLTVFPGVAVGDSEART